MCGIAGIIRLDQESVDPASLDRLTDALSHRGPDGRGVVCMNNVGLGHRRLKILDLSDAATQPMVSDDGNLILVFNGEIYNFQELRQKLILDGHIFHSTGDTEVLLKLYETEGKECLKKLRGMFAFAIYDRKNGTLFLARDRLGKKPIKYFVNAQTFAFASELKALRTLPECPRGIDSESIHHYLTLMYVPSPQTGIVGIQKLPAATSLLVDVERGIVHTPTRYWSLRYEPKRDYSFEEWKERVTSTFEESVRMRMIADVPVGAFLSGGIDSAAIVAVMAKYSQFPIQTFSIGSPEETHNELPFAKITSTAFKTDHHPMELRPDIVHLLPTLVHQYEEPFADPSSIPTYLMAAETQKHVRVALNGDGGDENFAGYARYPILKFSLLWEKFPQLFHAPIRSLVRKFHDLRHTTLSYRMQRFEDSMSLPWEERYLQYISFFTEEEKSTLFKKQYERTDKWHSDRTLAARNRAKHRIEQAISMDIDTYLADDLLPKVDLGCMAHGLEARSPLLDHTLMELTATMPLQYKLRGYARKWMLKHMLRGVVPDAILQKKKTGFRLPLDRWFRTDLRSFVTDRLLSPSSTLNQLLDRSALEEFLETYFNEHIDYSDHVWALLWLEEWLRQYS